MTQSESLGFDYKYTKDKKLIIYRHGKQIMLKKGGQAVELFSELDGASDEECQHILAVATGQYKFGNEKLGSFVRKQKGSE